MSKGNFSISGWSTESDISVDVNKIMGQGGLEYPRLSIPMGVTLRPSEDEGKIKTFSLLWFCGCLYIDNMKIGEGFSSPLAEYSWTQLRVRQIMIEIPLDFHRLEKIEERRRGDIEFRLSGTALIAEHPSVAKATSYDQQEFRRDVERFSTARFDITLGIPQSHWVQKILPRMGYGKIILVEIPIPETIALEGFEDVHAELFRSQDFFRQGDYDKTVEHCRNALEPLKKVLPKIKTLLTDSKNEWVSEVGHATYDWIDKIYKKTRDVSSIPHHPPSIGHFSRFEAHSIFLVTVALLSYSAKLMQQKAGEV